MEVLAFGDLHVPSSRFSEAIEGRMGEGFGPVREASWEAGSIKEEHHLQQVMEKEGPEAVPTPAKMVDTISDAEILAVHFAPVPEALFEAANELKAVIVARAGYENVNVGAASKHGVSVVNIQGRNAPAVAEQAIAFMLAEARDVARADAGTKAGRWPKEFPGPSQGLSGRTVGLIGFGQVARQLTKKISGFDVELLVYDPYVDAKTISSYGGEKVEDMDRIFCEGDFVSLHARLTQETARFIGREHFDLMKPTAYFINNARSRMVRYGDLYAVLKEGRIAGAALDVHDDEPLPDGSPWLELENVTLAPHIAGATTDTLDNTVRLTAEAVEEFARTGRCKNTVNVAALEGT